jgi:uncharacterized membrane protein YdjX (TVP38/TMEM64 family)
MCVVILLCGMETLSWYAELAFRTRVSMSAIGSVIVMAAFAAFSPGFPAALSGGWTYGVLGGTCRR